MGYRPSDPQTPDDWIAIADREMKDARACLTGSGSPEGLYYHAGLAVEAALKAVIWKRKRWNSWPDSKSQPDLYRHNLNRMMRLAGLEAELAEDPDVFVAWNVVREWRQQPRYTPAPMPNKVALDMIRCVRHPDYGILPWLIQRYSRT